MTARPSIFTPGASITTATAFVGPAKVLASPQALLTLLLSVAHLVAHFIAPGNNRLLLPLHCRILRPELSGDA